MLAGNDRQAEQLADTHSSIEATSLRPERPILPAQVGVSAANGGLGWIQGIFPALYGPFMNCPYRAGMFTSHNPGLRSLRSLRLGLTESALQAEETWLHHRYVNLLIALVKIFAGII